MGKVRLPLDRFPLIHTRSLEEAEVLQSTINSPVRATKTERRARYEWQANRISVGGLGIVASRYEAATIGHASNLDGYSLIIASQSGGKMVQAGHETPMAPGKIAVMASPSGPGDFHIGSRYRGIQIAIPPSMVSGALRTLTGHAPSSPPLFEPAID